MDRNNIYITITYLFSQTVTVTQFVKPFTVSSVGRLRDLRRYFRNSVFYQECAKHFTRLSFYLICLFSTSPPAAEIVLYTKNCTCRFDCIFFCLDLISSCSWKKNISLGTSGRLFTRKVAVLHMTFPWTATWQILMPFTFLWLQKRRVFALGLLIRPCAVESCVGISRIIVHVFYVRSLSNNLKIFDLSFSVDTSVSLVCQVYSLFTLTFGDNMSKRWSGNHYLCSNFLLMTGSNS